MLTPQFCDSCIAVLKSLRHWIACCICQTSPNSMVAYPELDCLGDWAEGVSAGRSFNATNGLASCHWPIDDACWRTLLSHSEPLGHRSVPPVSPVSPRRFQKGGGSDQTATMCGKEDQFQSQSRRQQLSKCSSDLFTSCWVHVSRSWNVARRFVLAAPDISLAGSRDVHEVEWNRVASQSPASPCQWLNRRQ